MKKPSSLNEFLTANEKWFLARALVQHGFNRTHTAKGIGISRRTLLNKIKDLSLTRGECRNLAGDVLPLPLPADVAAEDPAELQ